MVDGGCSVLTNRVTLAYTVEKQSNQRPGTGKSSDRREEMEVNGECSHSDYVINNAGTAR